MMSRVSLSSWVVYVDLAEANEVRQVLTALATPKQKRYNALSVQSTREARLVPELCWDMLASGIPYTIEKRFAPRQTLRARPTVRI